MKILDLNKYKKQETDYFSLWWMEYKYSLDIEDKLIFFEVIENINKKTDIIKKLIKTFKKILSKQNEMVVILKEDVIWLLNYFTYKFI